MFRGWSQPLGDFAVHEFLALYRLFSTESAGAEAEAHVLGEADDVARRLMRDSVGPVPIRARLSESVADAIGRTTGGGYAARDRVRGGGRSRSTRRHPTVVDGKDALQSG